MNLKLQTVQPEFLAKLLQDVESFKTNVDNFVDDYTDKLVRLQPFHVVIPRSFSSTLT